MGAGLEIAPGMALEHLRQARREGWVDWAEGILESFPGLRRMAASDPSVAAEIAEAGDWLAWAVPYEASNGRHSLLRTDLEEVRAAVAELNPILSAMGLEGYPERADAA